MKYRKLGVLLAISMVVATFYMTGLGDYLNLDSIKNHRDRLQEYATAHTLASVGFFVALYILQTALAMPGGALLTLLGGFLFGSFLGTVYVNIGATCGAILAFVAARYLLRQWAEQRFGKKVSVIQKGLEKNAVQYLLTLRMVPVFPFFLVNILLGLTRIPLSVYAFTTSLGIIPASFVYANAGKQLGSINSVADIATPSVLLSLALLGLLPLIPLALQHFKKTT